MENTKRVWLLGAPDPEMQAIEKLLRECGETVHYAEIDGRRVHPGNAYRVEAPELPLGVTGYAVECVDQLAKGWVRIDHHRPGDPGYGRPPEYFLSASSLGQVIAILEPPAFAQLWPSSWEFIPGRHTGLASCSLGQLGRFQVRGNGSPLEWGITTTRGPLRALHVAVLPMELVFTAAADHCLAGAYRGECPGVRPGTLMEWRAEVRAKFQRRSKAEVLADIEAARDALRLAKKTELAPWIFVADLRGKQIPELPEAAAREGRCFLSTVRDRDGREKVGCMGGTPDQIRAFMESWAPEQGLTDIYGDPARGFAGGYLPAKEKK